VFGHEVVDLREPVRRQVVDRGKDLVPDPPREMGADRAGPGRARLLIDLAAGLLEPLEPDHGRRPVEEGRRVPGVVVTEHDRDRVVVLVHEEAPVRNLELGGDRGVEIVCQFGKARLDEPELRHLEQFCGHRHRCITSP
jgi:hypothetical protein